MTLRTWLVLFIISMAVNAEVLAWAYRNGQFHQVNRGRWMPLRAADAAPATPPRRRPWALLALLGGLLVMTLVWMLGIATLLMQSFGHPR